MASFAFILCTLAILWQRVLAVAVFEALQSSNAGLFAQWVEQDQGLASLYSSSKVKTVFAPVDDAFRAYNQTGHLSQLRRVLVRQAGLPSEAGLQHVSGNLNHLNEQSPDSNRTQPVVGLPSSSNGASGVSSRQKRQSNNSTTQTLRFYSGLGNSVSVIHANIPYDGGLIHTLDGFFTLPQSWDDTFAYTNTTSFSSGLNRTGLASIISNPKGATIFSTPNEVYDRSIQQNITTASLTSTLSNHVIPNFLGYTPNLANGTILTTQSGNNLTVKIIDGEWFINNAKIIGSDQICSYGVAHIVDSIIETSTSPSVPAYTGMAATHKKVEKAGVIASIAYAFLAWLL
ncbi:conserved hypothetical protein [Talaromyces stipitatus ATCC 10500]|uniref:FAS1 domain-containing protein n=1 Tax=Talaromyces stipitatus (strain ATCC 10500 / CBS 375.48 / QM 6759 / NRRL 1006) TaxID=441959 RepID=B8LUR4_TALSN|nr:uncharacterized protein TSTA_073110 [Talaromyces stipitatus ATCC 10500]EED23921.1 conserved hypothetical protein [Talaromyces stipitatus ATCC 10500]